MPTAPPSDVQGLPVDAATCFSDAKGAHRGKLEKRQRRLLGKAAGKLKLLLEPDEHVLLAVPACSPMTLLEQLTTGWVIYYLKRCQLVLTNKRILQLAARSDLSPRHPASEVRYGDLQQAKVAQFLGRSLKLRYRNGVQEQFHHLEAWATAKLKGLLPGLVGRGPQLPGGGRRSLCPRCAKALQREVYRCGNCFLEFKTPGAALRYSLIFPGGGYFYTGHPVLGVLDALTETILLALVLVGLVQLWSGGAAGEDVAMLVIVGLALAFEKLISVFHARHYVREFLPVERELVPLRATS